MQGDDSTVVALGVSAAIAVTLTLICIPMVMFVKYRRLKKLKNAEFLGLFSHCLNH